MPETVNGKEFLTVKEAARFLKLSVSRLYQLKATDKTLPFHKIGEKILFERTELGDWAMKK